MIKKLTIRGISDEEIDFYNFFKNNDSIENENGPAISKIKDQREFEEYIKRKKNKKGKKARYPLPSACLGCMSYYHEQYNSFLYCQDCYVRFHRYCYPGFNARDDLLNKDGNNILC